MSFYRWCVVPNCINSTSKTPEKLFIKVPKDAERRNVWLELSGRDPSTLPKKSILHLCEDHFDLEQDMENYMQYKIIGPQTMIKMKPNIVPSKFNHIPIVSRQRKAESTSISLHPDLSISYKKPLVLNNLSPVIINKIKEETEEEEDKQGKELGIGSAMAKIQDHDTSQYRDPLNINIKKEVVEEEERENIEIQSTLKKINREAEVHGQCPMNVNTIKKEVVEEEEREKTDLTLTKHNGKVDRVKDPSESNDLSPTRPNNDEKDEDQTEGDLEETEMHTPKKRKPETEDPDTPNCKRLKTVIRNMNDMVRNMRMKYNRLKEQVEGGKMVSLKKFKSEASRTLAMMQVKIKKRRVKFWNQDEKELCIDLYKQSTVAYNYMRRKGIVLARPSRIKSWLSH